jgi:hypothetical protein
MVQNVQRLVDRTRRYMQDPAGTAQGQTFADSDLVDLLNEEQDEMIATMIEGSEDYFGVAVDLAFQANVNVYPLFDGCLFLRKLSFLGNGTQTPSDAIESRLIEGVSSPGGIATPEGTDYFYSVYGDNINVQPTPTADQAAAMRQYAIRDPGPMILETLTTPNIVDASNFKLASVDAPKEDDILIGTRVHVVAGTGIGQMRKIADYVGSTRLVTVDLPFSPALDNTSKIATETRIVRLFHNVLPLGAAIRSKAIVEEDSSKIQRIYDRGWEKFEDFVYRSRTYAQRSIAPFDMDAF